MYIFTEKKERNWKRNMRSNVKYGKQEISVYGLMTEKSVKKSLRKIIN